MSPAAGNTTVWLPAFGTFVPVLSNMPFQHNANTKSAKSPPVYNYHADTTPSSLLCQFVHIHHQLNSTRLDSTQLALYWIGLKKPNSHWIVYSTFDTGWCRFRWLLRSRRPVVPSFVSSSVPIGVVAASVVTVVAAVPLLIAWSLSALIFTGCVVGIITVVVGVVGVVVVAASNGCLNGCSVWHHCQHNLLVCLCVCVFMQF